MTQETSRASYADLQTSGTENSLCRMVLQTLFEFGPHGGTSEEVARVLHLDLQSITPRFAPLARKGLIQDSGQRRPGRSGKARIVWQVRS